jgi:hypothetical protein
VVVSGEVSLPQSAILIMRIFIVGILWYMNGIVHIRYPEGRSFILGCSSLAMTLRYMHLASEAQGWRC